LKKRLFFLNEKALFFLTKSALFQGGGGGACNDRRNPSS
jgi:hypothetical protein